MATPKKNVEYSFPITLVSPLTPGKFVINPTISAGDFTISIDGGAFVSLTNIPVAIGASKSVLVILTAAEMNGDKIIVLGSDPDDTWDDIEIFIDNPVANEIEFDDARKILQNRQIVNEITNKLEVYDDADTVIEFEGTIFKDDGVTLWNGVDGIVRRNKLDKI
jgi:hypothetical protein